jgi:hypothetical protein
LIGVTIIVEVQNLVMLPSECSLPDNPIRMESWSGNVPSQEMMGAVGARRGMIDQIWPGRIERMCFVVAALMSDVVVIDNSCLQTFMTQVLTRIQREGRYFAHRFLIWPLRVALLDVFFHLPWYLVQPSRPEVHSLPFHSFDRGIPGIV